MACRISIDHRNNKRNSLRGLNESEMLSTLHPHNFKTGININALLCESRVYLCLDKSIYLEARSRPTELSSTAIAEPWGISFGDFVKYEVFTAVTVRNVVFLDTKTQSVTHRRHVSDTESRRLMLCKIEVFTAVNMKNAVFWDVTPCDSCKNRRFGGIYRLHHRRDRNRRARSNVSSN
jgi:hypothetical protein